MSDLQVTFDDPTMGSTGLGDLLSAWWPLALTALIVVAAAMAVTAAAAWRSSRVAVVDVTWGAGFVLVALAGAVVGSVAGDETVAGTSYDPDDTRRWLLAAVVAVWGLRLAWHIRGRAQGHGEDPRYAELIGVRPEEDKRAWFALGVRKVFVVQAVALWLISWPVQVGQALPVAAWWLVGAGVVVTAVGVVFEAVGDAQLAAYKRVPKDERPPVMETGLWRYTRHPNYFGDACVWWGLWLAGGLASGWVPGLVTLVAPVAMTYFLVFATGARLLERSMMERPGYPEYAERTSMFVPLPPKRR